MCFECGSVTISFDLQIVVASILVDCIGYEAILIGLAVGLLDRVQFGFS